MNGDNQQPLAPGGQTNGQWQFRPEGTPPTAPVAQAPQPPAPAQAPQSQEQFQQQPQQYTPVPAEQYQYQQPDNRLPQPAAEGQEVIWTASEFIAHGRGAGWFGMLGIGVIVVAALAYLMTRDFVSVFFIVLMLALVVIAATRKPRVLNYRVSSHGLDVGNKFYPYNQFKSFSVMDEGAFSSIMFVPMQRFMPALSIYYDPADEERIIAALSLYLPLEQREHDVMDNLARRMRF